MIVLLCGLDVVCVLFFFVWVDCGGVVFLGLVGGVVCFVDLLVFGFIGGGLVLDYVDGFGVLFVGDCGVVFVECVYCG